MHVVTKIPARWRNLISDAMRFGIVGAVNTVVDFLVFNLFLQIGPLKANVISTVVATTSSYGMNRRWTFRDRSRRAMHREYTLFFAFNIMGMLIQLGVLGLVKYGLGFNEHTDRWALNAAKAAGIAVAMVFRFWAYRTFVFAPHPSAGASPAVEPATATVAAGGAGATALPGFEMDRLTADLNVLTADLDVLTAGTDQGGRADVPLALDPPLEGLPARSRG